MTTMNEKFGEPVFDQLNQTDKESLVMNDPKTYAMERFFDTVDEQYKLKLPTGEILHDTAIIPDFCSRFLKIDASAVWESAMACPTHTVEDDISRGDGKNPIWIPGAHKALNYRGNEIKRDKIWLQKDFDSGMKRYGYTGWQWAISNATKRVESMPLVESLADKIQQSLKLSAPHNHWILTRYGTGEDNIGAHSDKMKDWVEGSCFVVIKFGASRRFEFHWDEPKVAQAKEAVKVAEKVAKAAKQNGTDQERAKQTLKEAKAALKIAITERRFNETFYSELLPEGAAVVVGMGANVRVRHGVPKAKEGEPSGVSGSLVGRAIKTTFLWENVEGKISKRRKLV